LHYWHEFFGMRVASFLDLWGPSVTADNPDFVIQLRTVDDELRPATSVQWGRDATRSAAWAIWPGLARVLAHDSGEVMIDAKRGLDEPSLHAFVVMTALPLALQTLPGLLLQASAIRWRGQALVIFGRGHCGKSTLAALMAELGAELLADSHCFVRLDATGGLSVAPALPHVRLWPSQVRLLGPGWPVSRALRPGLEKQIFVVPERFTSIHTGIKGLILLRRGVDERFRLHRLDVAECLQALALASDRLRTDVNKAQTAMRFEIMSKLAALPVCHLIQWPRWGLHELQTRSRLLDLLADQGWAEAA